MKILITAIFLFLALLSQSQINKYGYPLYTYYDNKAYNANDQNWDIIEDKDGIIYVANNDDGILQFDGVSWRKIEIEKKPDVRTIAIDTDQTIYVGCSNDFGYLSPTLNGDLEFISLLTGKDSSFRSFALIFKINIIEDTIFFSTDNSILFKYLKNEKILTKILLPNYSLFTFAINNNLYGSSFLDGLYQLKGNTTQILPEGDFFKNKNIFSVLSSKKQRLTVITGPSGVYKYSAKGDIIPLLSKDDSKYLKSYTIYAATKSKQEILLATLGSGVIVLDSNYQIQDIYDQQIGIKDHWCASVDLYRNSVWSALPLGISRFEVNSPFRYYSKESKLEGYIIDIVRFNDDLFVATETGLFYLKQQGNKPPVFTRIDGIDSQIRSMIKIDDRESGGREFILIGTWDGIFQLNSKSEKPTLIDKQLVGINKLLTMEINNVESEEKSIQLAVNKLVFSKRDNKLWVGTKTRLISIQNQGENWKIDTVYETGDLIKNIIQDRLGNIWVATKQIGLFEVEFNTGKLNRYDVNEGLPSSHGIDIFSLSGGLYSGTPQGVYKFDSNSERFFADTVLPKKYTNTSTEIKYMATDGEDRIYINYSSNSDKGLDIITLKENSNEVNKDFYRLGKLEINNGIYLDNGTIWFGISDVLYSYKPDKGNNYDIPYKCLIRRVVGIDSTYFNGTYFKETTSGIKITNIQPEQQKPILPYALNDITFHYAAPYYEGGDAVVYSYQLIGFKNDWSKWNKEPKAVFTNLNEGKYTFKVKAKNIYGIESETGSFEFTILPPWYRTIIAYLFYIIVALFFVWIIVKLYTRRLKQEKIRLEGLVRERTAEIRQQRDEIAEQKQSIEDSIHYARRIQRAILPSDDMANEILHDYFILFRPRDIVSGDYFWMNKIGSKTIVVAADCTGHGVPGAFMSMLGVSFLNEIVLKDQVIEAHMILNNLRERVKKTLKQEGKEGEAKDGMDIALVVIDEETKKIYYAGAYNPVFIFRDEELFEIKADRMPIGIYIKEKESFTLHEFDYQKGDTFYIFSDGYPDQFGGEHMQKFRIKAMKELLRNIQDKSMEEQKQILNQTILDWMGDKQEQIDDMVVIGVRLN